MKVYSKTCVRQPPLKLTLVVNMERWLSYKGTCHVILLAKLHDMYLYKTDNFFHINHYSKSVLKVALLHRFYCTQSGKAVLVKIIFMLLLRIKPTIFTLSIETPYLLKFNSPFYYRLMYVWQTMQTLIRCRLLGHLIFVLRFYGPVNPMGSCRAPSVYLTTRLLGRLSPLSG